MKKRLLLILVIVLISSVVYAHTEEEPIPKPNKIYIPDTSTVAWIGFTILFVFLLVVIFFNEKLTETLKKTLYIILAITTISVTIYFIATTLHLNLTSETKGPVHWHADFEIWKCEEKINLVDPKGLSNKLGSSVFHEHNDNRIHVEGVVTKKQEVDLHSFFKEVGGTLNNDYFFVPTNEGFTEMRTGDSCNGEEGKLLNFYLKFSSR